MAVNIQAESELLTMDEVAERLKVKPKTVRAWQRQGLPVKRIAHRTVRLSWGEVLRWVEERNAAAGGC